MPLPTDPYGSELRSVMLFHTDGRSLSPAAQTVVNALAIRDTTAREFLLDCRGYPSKGLIAVNGLNQNASVDLGFSVDAALTAGQKGLFNAGVITVPSGGGIRWIGIHGTTSGNYVAVPQLEDYLDYLYIVVTCGVAPTTGTFSLYLFRSAI